MDGTWNGNGGPVGGTGDHGAPRFRFRLGQDLKGVASSRSLTRFAWLSNVGCGSRCRALHSGPDPLFCRRSTGCRWSGPIPTMTGLWPDAGRLCQTAASGAGGLVSGEFAMAMKADAKQRIVTEYRTHDKDTGSPEVQIALLTERINELRGALRRPQEGPLVPPRAAEAGQPAEPVAQVPDPRGPHPLPADHRAAGPAEVEQRPACRAKSPGTRAYSAPVRCSSPTSSSVSFRVPAPLGPLPPAETAAAPTRPPQMHKPAHRKAEG